MPVSQGVVGNQTLTSGNQAAPISLNVSGAQLSADSSARCQEAVLRGKVFSFTDVTPRAIALATATAMVGFALLNPAGSGYNLVMLYAGVECQVAGTAVGTICLVTRTGTGAAACTGTAATEANRLLGGSGGVGQALTTPTLDAAGVVIDTLGTQTTAALTTGQWPTFGKWLDGSIIVGENCAITFGTITTALAAASGVATLIWEEVPN